MAEYVDSRTRAKQFRTMLKETFPGVKFSVRCDTGTAYNWISVTWEDGPADSEVQDLLRPLHADLSTTRSYSMYTERQAANVLKAHYPEIEVFQGDERSINWNAETYRLDIVIGRKHVRNLTMDSILKDIASIYILGGEERFPNAAERAVNQAARLAEKAAESKAAPQELASDDENLVQHEAGEDFRDAEEARGRLVRGNPFVLGMYPGEKPHLDVRKVTPFEAVLTAVPDPQEPVEEQDLTPRQITSLSPFGRPLAIFSVPALVMADTDGYQAGEVVWVGKTISTVLDDVERVLVSRGDGQHLQPVTTNFLILI
jgi:hypothetical protein